ncbi:MAG: hypothetical protein LLF76_02085 [Planctomycetaceae bacterium]|nr:hypothetical protein [Planctomycetaceae bacterium]
MVERYSLKRIWEDLAMPDLAISIKLAVGPTKLVLAFCGIVLICSLGYLMDLAGKSVVIGPAEIQGEQKTELDVYIADPAHTRQFIEANRETAPRKGVFNVLWSFTSARFHDSTLQLLNLGNANIFANVRFAIHNLWLCIRAVAWAFIYHPVYSTFFFVAIFIVSVFFGGAICRCAALEFARNEKPGLVEALRFAWENFRAFVCALLIPLGLALLLILLLLGAGLVCAVPWIGELFVGALFGFILLAGLLIAILLVGLAAGGLLLFPSVAYEKTGGLDAVGRSFAYLLNRPLWMMYYLFISAVLGTFFYLVFRWLVFVILKITYAMLSLGMTLGGQPQKLERIWLPPQFFGFVQRASENASLSETAASMLIYFFLLLILSLLICYIVSFLFSAAAVIYALLRKKVDRVELDHIFVHLDYFRGANQG